MTAATKPANRADATTIAPDLTPDEYDAIMTAITAVGASMDRSASEADIFTAIRVAKLALTDLGSARALALMLRLSNLAQLAWGENGTARVQEAPGQGPRVVPMADAPAKRFVQ